MDSCSFLVSIHPRGLVKRQVLLLLGLRQRGEEELVSLFQLQIKAVVPLARDEASPATEFDQQATSAQPSGE